VKNEELFISGDDFENISLLIYRKTGIRFEEKKIYFLANRIKKRIIFLNLDSTAEYLRFLKFSDPDGIEFQHFVNNVTINETYFFRDFPQLQAFADHCLPDIVDLKIKNNSNCLKFWSAGCSTGEEAYTLGIILSEMFEDIKKWDISIVASDIDQNVLKHCENGIYNKRSIKDVPPDYLEKYFKKHSEDSYEISKDIKKLVRFEHLNLTDKDKMRNRFGFDFIFCRNVLIYFDDESRGKVVEHFYTGLNKGGYIFLGSSESIGRITAAFKLKRINKFLVYCKE